MAGDARLSCEKVFSVARVSFDARTVEWSPGVGGGGRWELSGALVSWGDFAPKLPSRSVPPVCQPYLHAVGKESFLLTVDPGEFAAVACGVETVPVIWGDFWVLIR